MGETDGAGSGAPAGGRGLRIALGLSVAFNLLVLGIAAGAMFGHHRMGHLRDVGFGPYTEALSLHDRHALRAAYLAELPDLRAMRRQSRDDFDRLAAALRAEPWDAAAVRAIIAANAARTEARLETGRRLLIAHIDAMAPEARRAFADRLEETRHGRSAAADPGS